MTSGDDLCDTFLLFLKIVRRADADAIAKFSIAN